MLFRYSKSYVEKSNFLYQNTIDIKEIVKLFVSLYIHVFVCKFLQDNKSRYIKKTAVIGIIGLKISVDVLMQLELDEEN